MKKHVTFGFRTPLALCAIFSGAIACSHNNGTNGGGPGHTMQAAHFCELPGSVVFDGAGRHVVGGNDASPTPLPWLTLPSGFCAHHYATVATARQIRFAPGGELFVASPSKSTVGGGSNGLASIVVVPDDDGDGVGDTLIPYVTSIAATQGMLFLPGWFYYQNDTRIVRVPYRSGDRGPSGATEVVADITVYKSLDHWPKALDAADDGTIYVSNGGDQFEQCSEPYPFEGGVLVIDGTPGGRQIVRGLRNPAHLRCQHGHNHCFAAELARDYSAAEGGREKLIPVHEGDDWGHPCCATKDKPFSDINPPPDCSGVTAETNAFLIGNTPFGFDFAPANWPKPWGGNVMLALHGSFGDWGGARLVAIETDPATGMPLHSSTTDARPSGAISDFATGWDDGSRLHGRPGDVSFSPDGRMFVADDQLGEIFWVAPVTGG